MKWLKTWLKAYLDLCEFLGIYKGEEVEEQTFYDARLVDIMSTQMMATALSTNANRERMTDKDLAELSKMSVRAVRALLAESNYALKKPR